jgi:mannose-1-phosphate guanylyltransferase / mannose-6-phosphate isomerase
MLETSLMTYTPVVLCGGSGSRLWPLSRTGFPKQFLVLHGTQSLFQQSVKRLVGLASPSLVSAQPLIVTNESHRFLVAEQWRELDVGTDALLLLEPEGRNTAPAITLAAKAAIAAAPADIDPILVVSPADQVVTDGAAFSQALRRAIERAQTGAVVVLGVSPISPETGYGYIRRGVQAAADGAWPVIQFTEKPDFETAQQYLASGEYAWNAGIFVVRASVWLKAIERFTPEISQRVEASWAGAAVDHQFVRPLSEAFLAAPAISADYAVLERCPGSEFLIEVVALDAGWSDLGAWDAVWALGEKDHQGNVTVGDAVAINTKNTLVHASHRLVGTVGVEDLVIVETADAVLVGHRDQAQQVKTIVELLSKQKREEHQLHRKVHRPWGWYDSIDEADRFKVKRIMVKPGASLSLQKHHHRAEHWIVVQGTAEITCGDKVMVLSENESTYIPLGEIHRLANPGKIPLEIIEVQSGSYLGEDDIVRLEDNYQRAGH